MSTTPSNPTAALHHLPFWRLDLCPEGSDIPGAAGWALMLGGTPLITLCPVALESWHPMRRDDGLTMCWVVEFDRALWPRDGGWHGGEYYASAEATKAFFLAFWCEHLRETAG